MDVKPIKYASKLSKPQFPGQISGMRSSLVSSVFAAVVAIASGQTVYLAGDSTMAKGGGGSGTDGKDPA